MKQRIYRNYFWVALTTILIVSFVFVFSYNQTIHDQKEEGMREEAEFISALLEKQGDADVGFQAAAGKTDFRITLIAENGMVLYDNKVKDVSGMENHAKRPEILKASKNGEGSIEVSVTLDDAGVITDVEVTKNGDDAGISDPAVEGVPAAIVAANSLAVDAVAGATLTRFLFFY